MNPTLKKHLVSAVITFIATFATSFGTLIVTVDPEKIDISLIVSFAMSAITVALRAFMKVLLEA